MKGHFIREWTKRHIRSLGAAMAAFALLPVRAAEPDMTFQHLNVADGISQSSVLAITQDRLGRIWLGTQNGLNCYDGYEFTVFHADPSDSLSLPVNYITALEMGADGTMWIGTSAGLASFDFGRNRFKRHTRAGKLHIHDIQESDGRLALATDKGLFYYDAAHDSLTREAFIEETQTYAAFYADGILYAATERGLVSINGDRKEKISQFEGMDVCDIEQVGGTGWWIGTYGQGLFRTDSRFNIIKHYGAADGSLPSDFIRVMDTDGYGRLWAGTYEGLAVYDDIRAGFSIYTHSDNPNSLSHNSVRSIFTDNQNGVWLGTWFGGVNYWNRQYDKLRTISLSGSGVYGFVSCLAGSPGEDVIWVGTNDDGIWQYFPRDDSVRKLDLDGISGNIKCIVSGSDGNLYAGAHLGGLMRIDTRRGTVRSFKLNPRTPLSNSCYSLMEDAPGDWWVGTLEGLLRFDSRSESLGPHPVTRLEPELLHAYVTCLVKDNKGRVWIGTNTGVYALSPSRDRILSDAELFRDGKMSGLSVTQVTQDRFGNIWIASKTGLIRYQENGSAYMYTSKDGLPDDQVCAILTDESGILWISTGDGICSLDPDNGTVRGISRSRKNEFNPGAGHASGDGYHYFGGLGGITRFRPHDMYSNPFAPSPFVKEAVTGGKGSCSVTRDPDGKLTVIEISPEVNTLTLTWSVVNPLSYGDNTFSYVLEGFDDNWYDTHARQVSYSNLPPGHYTLRLAASNSEGRRCNQDTVLKLHVRPRWWQTFPVQLLLVLLTLAALGAIVQLIVSRIKTGIALDKEHAERLMAEDNLRQTRELLLSKYTAPENQEVLSADEEFLKRAVQVIENNIDNESFSSSDFATEMFMSRSNLYLRITSLTGESATQFIRRIRMERACQLLRERKHSVAEISAMVGFSSPSYFATSFKKHMGCLPTEYARKWQVPDKP